MKVILLKAVPKVGKAGDVVDVQDGYASNALFPKKLAIPATQKAMSALQKEKDSKVQASALAQELLEKAIESLPNDEVVITARANEKGHLFSKIDEKQVVEAFFKHRIALSKDSIVLPVPIKEVGKYTLVVRVGNLKRGVVLSVVAQ